MSATNPSEAPGINESLTAYAAGESLEATEAVVDTNNPPKIKPKRFNPRQLKKQSKIGRNDPCPCGSGQKYKKCCLIKREEYFEKQVEMAKQVEELLDKTAQTDIKGCIKKEG